MKNRSVWARKIRNTWECDRPPDHSWCYSSKMKTHPSVYEQLSFRCEQQRGDLTLFVSIAMWKLPFNRERFQGAFLKRVENIYSYFPFEFSPPDFECSDDT